MFPKIRWSWFPVQAYLPVCLFFDLCNKDHIFIQYVAAVHDGLIFPAVYVNHCGCPFIFTSSGICFKGIRQPQSPSFFFHIFFASIVKYNVMGTRNFQQMLAVQPLGSVNQFPVQIRIIQKSPERHIRVIGTLMFVKAQCFVNQK